MSAPDFRNLAAAIEDTRLAAIDMDPGPPDITDFDQLRGRLIPARVKLSPVYQREFFDPFSATLNDLDASGFARVLRSDPNREGVAGLLLDSAQAILQFTEGFSPKPLVAFQQVIADLYDGFLSAEDRRGVLPPDRGIIAPLVKFGNPEFGPYTWTIEATGEVLRAGAGIVSMPPSHARKALLGWSALGHETGGHDIMAADTGLKGQIATAIQRQVLQAINDVRLARYWSSRVDETASDVLGILNMGPAVGVGLIGYFRGLNATQAAAKLRNNGPSDDPHPADIVRGFLAAETIRLLEFSDATAWANAIEAETMRDVTSIRLANIRVNTAQAKQMAAAVAKAIVETPFPAIENVALGDIQNWRDIDESIVASIRSLLVTPGGSLPAGAFAAHVVAAAVTLVVSSSAVSISLIFARMVDLLKQMFDRNPTFGPLHIRQAGNVSRDRAYIPNIEAEEEAPPPKTKVKATGQ